MTGVVLHEPRLAAAVDEQLALLLHRERPRADAAEDRDLPARLVDRAVAMQAFRNRQRGLAGSIRRDQLGLGLRTESIEPRLALGAHELEHLQTVLPVRDVGEQR